MSKTEEIYLECFQDGRVRNCSSKEVFLLGYHQAEKDLELTWEDIELIVNIDKDTDNEESIIGVRKNEEHYQEVLKRFKEIKK